MTRTTTESNNMNIAIDMERNALGSDKVSRYGWKMKDGPGDYAMLPKGILQIHPDYQRDLIETKVLSIASDWSWRSLGALVVGCRDGAYWVIDGQHRVLAAKRRSDISMLPCIVFNTESVRTEAQAFLDLNTGRKPVTAVGKQKALVAAGDEVAAYVNQQCREIGLEIRATALSVGSIKCVAWCMRRASEDKDAFRAVLELAAELCNKDKMPVPERLLEGLWLINAKCENGLNDKRLLKRINEKGARSLLDAANRASAYYAAGGGKIWAQGILSEVNKGLQHKFSMGGDEA